MDTTSPAELERQAQYPLVRRGCTVSLSRNSSVECGRGRSLTPTSFVHETNTTNGESSNYTIKPFIVHSIGRSSATREKTLVPSALLKQWDLEIAQTGNG